MLYNQLPHAAGDREFLCIHRVATRGQETPAALRRPKEPQKAPVERRSIRLLMYAPGGPRNPMEAPADQFSRTIFGPAPQI